MVCVYHNKCFRIDGHLSCHGIVGVFPTFLQVGSSLLFVGALVLTSGALARPAVGEFFSDRGFTQFPLTVGSDDEPESLLEMVIK